MVFGLLLQINELHARVEPLDDVGDVELGDERNENQKPNE
jgi:hypothetical protein